MTGNEFQALELEQQVEYINSLLKTTSLTKASASIGIARKTLSGQFERAGYKLDKNIKQYIRINNNTNEKAQKLNNKALSGSNSGNNSSNSLEKRVEGLEKQIEAIKAMLETNKNNTTELNIKVFEGEKVARSYKVNIEVQKQFKAFCKAHSEYEVGDILANAMLEFMNKYK